MVDFRAHVEAGRSVALAQYALELAEALDTARRIGAPTDKPEGTRLVHMSDTLARTVADRLRSLASGAISISDQVDNARQTNRPMSTREAQASLWQWPTDKAFERLDYSLRSQTTSQIAIKTDLAALAHIREEVEQDFRWKDKLDQIWVFTRGLLTSDEKDNSGTLEEMIDELSKRPTRHLTFDECYETFVTIDEYRPGSGHAIEKPDPDCSENYEKLCAQTTGADAEGEGAREVQAGVAQPSSPAPSLQEVSLFEIEGALRPCLPEADEARHLMLDELFRRAQPLTRDEFLWFGSEAAWQGLVKRFPDRFVENEEEEEGATVEPVAQGVPRQALYDTIKSSLSQYHAQHDLIVTEVVEAIEANLPGVITEEAG